MKIEVFERDDFTQKIEQFSLNVLIGTFIIVFILAGVSTAMFPEIRSVVVIALVLLVGGIIFIGIAAATGWICREVYRWFK